MIELKGRPFDKTYFYDGSIVKEENGAVTLDLHIHLKQVRLIPQEISDRIKLLCEDMVSGTSKKPGVILFPDDGTD